MHFALYLLDKVVYMAFQQSGFASSQSIDNLAGAPASIDKYVSSVSNC